MADNVDIGNKVLRLKNNVRTFVAATSNGTMTPAQVRQLGALLQENVDIFEALVRKNNDLQIWGRKVSQN